MPTRTTRAEPKPALRLTPGQARYFREANFGVVTTLRSDGTPQASVMWVDEDRGRPLFITTLATAKARNLLGDPRVTILVWDRADPYRYVEVEGLAQIDPEGANTRIDRISRKYGGPPYPPRPDRVIVRVQPTRIYVYPAPAKQ